MLHNKLCEKQERRLTVSLKEERINAGLTQKEMSALLEIPMRTIGSWEDGSRKCPPYVERLVIKELRSIKEKKAN